MLQALSCYRRCHVTGVILLQFVMLQALSCYLCCHATCVILLQFCHVTDFVMLHLVTGDLKLQFYHITGIVM